MVRAQAQAIENIGGSWSEHGTSIRMDVVSFLVALLLHAPLYWMRLDSHKKQTNMKTDRLVSIDLLETLKKEEPPPVAVATPAQKSMMDKLKMLVRKDPPPPPAPVVKKPEVVPEKLKDAPAPIALQAKLDRPELLAPKLESKSGFKTSADPRIVEQKQIALNQAPVGIAPLSAKRLGTIEDRSSLKADKGAFQVKTQSIGDIGGDSGPALAGAQTAPAIAIQTGSRGSTEKFSAPLPQKSDKGRIGAIPTGDLGGGPKLGLRDQIIARDAAPTQIGGTGRGSAGGVAGGIPGGTGSKRDAGRFQEGGVAGGVPGGTGSQIGAVGGPIAVAPIAPPATKPREKRSMFVITGELSNRQILKQVTPTYPAWAQAQGIEASVILEFTVVPEGDVKPSIVVRRTSGYPKLDQEAIKALENWKFAALTDGANREEVGLITFNFSLR